MPVIWINVYQIFLLCGIKFHCLVRRLPLTASQSFLLDVLVDLVEYTNALIQSQVKHLAPCHVRYLGRHALCAILKRKQTNYAGVLQVLENQLGRDGLEKQFEVTIDPKLHRLFLRDMLF